MEISLTLLNEVFEAVALQWPDRIAVDVPPGRLRPERRTVTYSELDERAGELAAVISPFVQKDSIVAILLNRESELLYMAQLAILKAGAAYLCIDSSFPEAQIQLMLSDSVAVALLTDESGKSRMATAGFDLPNLLDITKCPGSKAQPSKPQTLTPESLAYVIYTSGTTGRPKGVMIEHRSIVNLVQSDITEFNLVPVDRVAQGSSAAYDSSVEEIWLAFASGATLVLLDDETVRSGPDLIDWLKHERITVLCPPPTLLRTTGCPNPSELLPDLRLLYVGGEPLTADVVETWANGCRLVNGYGPTECTVTCSRCDVLPGEEITIGRPVQQMTALILDAELNEVVHGEAGELCFSGTGLARGYINDPELTTRKFVQSPKLGRIYRTGDGASLRSDGQIVCLGRLDSQVKIRGYRIELEGIDTALSKQLGVREAACRVQTSEGREELVAFVVLADPKQPIDLITLRSELGKLLPAYMVPARIDTIDELPRSVGGKVKRDALPIIQASESSDLVSLAPRNSTESSIQELFQTVLGTKSNVSVLADFFTDLGGTSLLAAQLVSLMRADSALASVTVRDVYQARTIAGLATRVGPLVAAQRYGKDEPVSKGPALATLLQALFLICELVVGSALLACLFVGASGASYQTIMAIAVIAILLYPVLSVLLAVAVKAVLIGRYEAGRVPVWGSFFVRNWIVQKAVQTIPWSMFEGTEFVCMALRGLGAKIGQRVHFHRGSIPLEGGWDLLEVGNDVTFSQDASIRMVELESLHMVLGPIRVGDGAVIGVRAGLDPGTSLGADSVLSPLSSLKRNTSTGSGELWDGIPAQNKGPVLPAANLDTRPMSVISYSILLTLSRAAVSLAVVGPAIAVAIAIVLMLAPGYSSGTFPAMYAGALFATAAAPLTILFEALASRFMGGVQPGVIHQRSWCGIRIAIKSSLVESAGRGLSGTLFWPVWLRLAGMQVGPKCEISTIIDVVPELVEIGPECFLADGIYLGPPEIRKGIIGIGEVQLSKNTFVGNHAVIPTGQRLPEDILLGICTVSDQTAIRKGTSWFGLPPIELPRREIVELERNLTHAPGPIRYANRVFWELLRVVVPVGSTCAAAVWMQSVHRYSQSHSLASTALIGTPLISFEVILALAGTAILLKWVLLGKVKPGIHALWSCWCSRWDFHYVLWGEWARPLFTLLEGTALLNFGLRLLGMKIGRGVVLGEGFSQVVDPDMLSIGDGATVSAMFQAHTFEDRVLKIDKVTIQPFSTLSFGTVPQYGSDIGSHTHVTAHAVVMKHERLIAGLQYEGAPTRPTGMDPQR